MFILRTARKDIQRRLKDPFSFAIWLGIPLALGLAITLAFGGFSSGRTPTAEVWVVDEDESTVSGMVVTALASGGDFGFPLVAREVEAGEGRKLIDNGKGSALLTIPPNFGDDLLNSRPTELSLVTNPTQFFLPEIVEESLNLVVDGVFYLQQTIGEPIRQIVDSADTSDGFLENRDVAEISILINEAMIRMDTLLFPPVIDLEIVRRGEAADGEPASQGPGLIDAFLPSMLFMALVFMALGISEDIWVEKSQGTLRRALATPHASASFLAGKLLGATALMGAIVFLTIIAARFLLGAQSQNILQASVWGTLSGAIFVLFAYPLQLYAKSQRAGGVLSSLVIMPLMMLGGSFFPFEMMPEGLARIGRFTPNGWAQTELISILRDEADWLRVGISATGLIALGTILFFLANRRMAGAFVRN